MNENHSQKESKDESAFSRQVGEQAARKLKARRGSTKSIWFGLGVSGLIGWSIMIPTLIGALVGLWVDKHHPSQYSWTLMLLLMGLILGCYNAWHWVDSEYKEIQEDLDD